MSRLNELYGEWLRKLSSINVSDAPDVLGIHGSTCGTRPMAERRIKIVGPAVAMRTTAAGETEQKTHLGMNVISATEKSDVIVINDGGRMNTSCWGGILANAAKVEGVSGTMIDGCCRDLNDCMDADYTVYARGAVACTAWGRVTEESTSQVIQFEGVRVRPGDTIVGDSSGVVIIPQEHMEAVLLKAEEPWQEEEDMAAEIRSGADILEVGAGYNCNRML